MRNVESHVELRRLTAFRCEQNPFYEFSALYTAFFSSDRILYASGWASDCMLSVTEAPGTATAYAPAGPTLDALLAWTQATLKDSGIKLERIKHLPTAQLNAILKALEGSWREMPRDVEFEDREPQVAWKLEALGRAGILGAKPFTNWFDAPEFSNWRYQCKRFVREYGVPDIADFDVSSQQDLLDDLVLRACAHRGQPNTRSCDRTATGRAGIAEPILSFVRQLSTGTLPYFGHLILIEGKPVACWIGGEVSNKTAAAYVFIADRDYNAASEFCLIDCMATTRTRGFDVLCLGGSETRGLLDFKAWHFGTAFEKHGSQRYVSECETLDAKASRHHRRSATRR